MNSQNGLNKSELYTLGIGVIIIIIFIFFGSVLTSPKNMDQSQNNSAAKGASAISAITTSNLKNISNDSHIQIYDEVVGTGAEAKSGSTVQVNYVGTLQNGTKFDSSYDRGQPISVTIGSGQVIKGWEIGLMGMKVGGKRKLVISPEYAYGNQAVGPIPANSTLVFEVELVSVK